MILPVLLLVVAGAPDLKLGLEKVKWTDTKTDVRKKYPKAEPQSEEGLLNVDSLNIDGFYRPGPGIRLDAIVYFDGSSATNTVSKIVLMPIPDDYNMTDAKLAALWKFVSDRFQLGPMPKKDTRNVETGGVKADLLYGPGDFGVVFHR